MTNYNDQHIHLIVDGLKAADAAEGTAVDEHRKVAVGIQRLLGSLNGNGKALRAEIKARLDGLGKDERYNDYSVRLAGREARFESLGPSELHNDYAVRLCGRDGDEKGQKAATNLRYARLWEARNPLYEGYFRKCKLRADSLDSNKMGEPE